MNSIRLLVFASGSETRGGSGFENLVNYYRNAGMTHLVPVAVVSNYEHGGVREKADRLGIKFIYFPGPFTPENYHRIIESTGATHTALSGWIKLVRGHDPRTTFNIHPGPFPRFKGRGMYGIHVHEAVLGAFKRGEITHSAVTMHFVSVAEDATDYDMGPPIFTRSVEVLPDDTPQTLQHRVNEVEHQIQPLVTRLVIEGQISWDGVNPSSVHVPETWHMG